MSDILTDLETLVREIAPQLPTGLADLAAGRKLANEQRELYDALAAGDWQGALTELADVAYYVGKARANMILPEEIAFTTLTRSLNAYATMYCVDPTPPTLIDLLRLVRAKYESRIAHGKDDAAERAACVTALGPRPSTIDDIPF